MGYTVALTGGIGSGKSTIAQAFASLGVEWVDADDIARQVVEPGTPALEKIIQRFGPTILLPDGRLDRRALRQYIFADANSKQWLNHLLHPLIHAQTQRQLDKMTSPWRLWVVPLLVENQLQNQADRVLVVDVPREIQLARAMARDGMTRQQAERILAAQASREARLAIADDIIDNSGTPASVRPRVAGLHQRYLALAAAAQQDGEYE
ncbi:dephospho-CoA kinase [Erwinia sp. OLTSP20]|uniref:dephospho-CoA kinase n=1 Tax=unclassified Erwinia TaxID=2622719 RepID=UPI000C1A0238|nr:MULTISPECIES: dephospho-CoA kinase [unclassified Erwinia]PIJ49762.1 dephospho-CoA kinase [Erwinia sp. OAMSP11]PIJ70861.1 dephospho-CoA kinase [Erwinia sp. OLSSP12]PIJ80226.1 dephospho-CoA kinase [Erwinia sp. OLCASP19]PIJ82350.1 dephospho-CoA kinase [Erwinia sp. OLMTSP26]PIJ85036.1 dephospho-CoA kinase [Erwinia sp. OLMDSP33]